MDAARDSEGVQPSVDLDGCQVIPAGGDASADRGSTKAVALLHAQGGGGRFDLLAAYPADAGPPDVVSSST